LLLPDEQHLLSSVSSCRKQRCRLFTRFYFFSSSSPSLPLSLPQLQLPQPQPQLLLSLLLFLLLPFFFFCSSPSSPSSPRRTAPPFLCFLLQETEVPPLHPLPLLLFF
ncbi:unnamed protein product, partial [Musa banksii]